LLLNQAVAGYYVYLLITVILCYVLVTRWILNHFCCCKKRCSRQYSVAAETRRRWKNQVIYMVWYILRWLF